MRKVSPRTGPIEEQIQRAVAAYLQTKGHGAATALGQELHRPPGWVTQFATGRRRATLDEAVALVRILRLRPNPLLEPGTIDPPTPLDEDKARQRAKWNRFLERLQETGDPELLRKTFGVVEIMARRSDLPAPANHGRKSR